MIFKPHPHQQPYNQMCPVCAEMSQAAPRSSPDHDCPNPSGGASQGAAASGNYITSSVFV